MQNLKIIFTPLSGNKFFESTFELLNLTLISSCFFSILQYWMSFKQFWVFNLILFWPNTTREYRIRKTQKASFRNVFNPLFPYYHLVVLVSGVWSWYVKVLLTMMFRLQTRLSRRYIKAKKEDKLPKMFIALNFQPLIL